jgi:hypothetical protein
MNIAGLKENERIVSELSTQLIKGWKAVKQAISD